MQKISNVMQCDFFAQEKHVQHWPLYCRIVKVYSRWSLEHIGTIVTCDTLW
jgi:hypothetical protein